MTFTLCFIRLYHCTQHSVNKNNYRINLSFYYGDTARVPKAYLMGNNSETTATEKKLKYEIWNS